MCCASYVVCIVVCVCLVKRRCGVCAALRLVCYLCFDNRCPVVLNKLSLRCVFVVVLCLLCEVCAVHRGCSGFINI